MSPKLRRFSAAAGILVLLAVFAVQLLLSSRRNSVTWDEGHHLFSGYMTWKQHHPEQALVEAQQAVALAPNLVNPQAALGDAMAALHRTPEARACYERALHLAETVEPQLQTAWIHDLQAKLAAL